MIFFFIYLLENFEYFQNLHQNQNLFLVVAYLVQLMLQAELVQGKSQDPELVFLSTKIEIFHLFFQHCAHSYKIKKMIKIIKLKQAELIALIILSQSWSPWSGIIVFSSKTFITCRSMWSRFIIIFLKIRLMIFRSVTFNREYRISNIGQILLEIVFT